MDPIEFGIFHALLEAIETKCEISTIVPIRIETFKNNIEKGYQKCLIFPSCYQTGSDNSLL